MINQRVVLGVSSLSLVLAMGGGALRVRHALADKEFAVAQRVQGRDQVMHLEKALDMSPGMIPARLLLARDLMGLGKYTRALTQIDQLLHTAPESTRQELHEDQAHALLALGQWKEAEDAIRAILTANPHGPQAWRNHDWLGQALEAQGQNAAAEAEYRAAITVDGAYSDAYTHLAMLLFKSGRNADAATLGRSMMAAGPQSKWQWWDILSRRAEAAGKLPEALADQQKAAAARLDGISLGREADLLIRLNQTDAAIAIWRQVTSREPISSPSHLGLAAALEARASGLGKKPAAEGVWAEAANEYRGVAAANPVAFVEWVAAGRGPRPENSAVVQWQEHLEMVVNPGDVRLMGRDSEPGIQQAWYSGDAGEHKVNNPLGKALFLQGALAQSRHDYTAAGQFYENALHFIPTAESPENSRETNEIRQAIEEGIDTVLQSQISGIPSQP